MAQITAAMVKELREMTGAGMMECKKALTEADGSLEAAVDVLRTRGLAAVAKKAGRATNEGYVMAVTNEEGTAGAIVELKCETDFVSGNEKFRAYVAKVTEAVMSSKQTDVEALKAVEVEGETVEAILTDCIHVMGENTELARVAYTEAPAVAAYIHGLGKIGVLVEFDVEDIDTTAAEFKQCGKDVAMQVAAIAPIAANREDVDPAVVEHEMGIYKAQAAESGKPEAIQEKIATGRLEKFFKEQCLTEQAFVKDSDKTVTEYVNSVAKALGGSIKVKSFTRFALGE